MHGKTQSEKKRVTEEFSLKPSRIGGGERKSHGIQPLVYRNELRRRKKDGKKKNLEIRTRSWGDVILRAKFEKKSLY